MVAVVAGAGLGLEGSSARTLGRNGLLGDPTQGRAGDQVYVNAATGNLVIQRRDEVLVGVGPGGAIARTYNSQGALTGALADDNADRWRASVSRKVTNLTGTVSTAGSTITRMDWDGSAVVYTWDTSRSAYVSTNGAGAYDTLTLTSTTWTWTDGDSRATELYDNSNGGRITQSRDADGNTTTFAYNGGGLVSSVTTATSAHTELTTLTYSGLI